MLANTYDGKLIALCGLDGSGKTTQSKLLLSWLTKKRIKASYTVEPTNEFIGRLIRKEILRASRKMSSECEGLLFAADRAYHVYEQVIPLLKKGQYLVSDRYVYSSIAYQGARGADIEWLWKINEFTVEPDLAIFIDVDPDSGIKRKGDKLDNFERVIDLQKNVREIFLDLTKDNKLFKVDGNQDKHEVHKAIVNLVQKHIVK